MVDVSYALQQGPLGPCSSKLRMLKDKGLKTLVAMWVVLSFQPAYAANSSNVLEKRIIVGSAINNPQVATDYPEDDRQASLYSLETDEISEQFVKKNFMISNEDAIYAKQALTYINEGNKVESFHSIEQIKDRFVRWALMWYIIYKKPYVSYNFNQIQSVFQQLEMINFPKLNDIKSNIKRLIMSANIEQNYGIVSKAQASEWFANNENIDDINSVLALLGEKFSDSYIKKNNVIASKDKDIEKIRSYLTESYFTSHNSADISKDTRALLERIVGRLQYLPSVIYKKDLETLKKIWFSSRLTGGDLRLFHLLFYRYLTPDDYYQKTSSLIDQKQLITANYLMNFADEIHRKLFVVRMNIIKNGLAGSDYASIIKSVPESLRNDESLLFDLASHAYNNGNYMQTAELIKMANSTSRQPDKWWKIKYAVAREMINSAMYKDAFAVVKVHNGALSDENYSEAEWMCGWLALRFVNQPRDALKYFQNIYNTSKYAVSLSRAAYWIGRSYADLGQKKQSQEWLAKAAQYPFFYYGQLAIEKLGENRNARQIMSKVIAVRNKQQTATSLQNEIIAKIGLSFVQIGEMELGKLFLDKYILSEKDNGKIISLIKVASFISDEKRISLALARTASRKQAISIKEAYYTINMNGIAEKAIQPLAMAIIRQESNFNLSAVSNKGATGLMQIMPGTARLVANKMGISYNPYKLKYDQDYNIRLGVSYLSSLLAQYDYFPILAIAAYNGGPGSVNRWIQRYGDPRSISEHDKMVDWVENISFSETRNYVMRVMENYNIYSYLLGSDG